VVHTLALAEHLPAAGVDVEVIALGDPAVGFFRPVAAPVRIVPAPAPAATLEERVFAAVDAMAAGLRGLGPDLPSIVHAQDCIAARAAVRLRDEGRPLVVVRTVHHVDDFTTEALIECQRRSILDPDRVLVVSRLWQDILLDEYGVEAGVVPNGVDHEHFAAAPDRDAVAAIRRRVADDSAFVFVTVGGIEPRKGSDHLVRSLSRLRDLVPDRVVLAVVGDHSFQDHSRFRNDVLDSLPGLGLEVGRDIVLAGMVPDAEMTAWYHAADALAFPSVKEGWGLAVLEAMAAGLPVVATDIPVFREYLTHGESALLVAPGDDEALAAALAAVVTDADVRARLAAAGATVARRYEWAASAARHVEVYDGLPAPTSRRRSSFPEGVRGNESTVRTAPRRL
jgi:glycosyltransferase-like protein